MNIEVNTDPPKRDSDILSKGITDFNKSEIPDLEPNEAEVKFFVFAKDEADTVVGGIRATCFWNTLHIELLWLSEESRGTGIGKQLIDSAESFAVKQDCEKAFVETTSWQARPFYERNGYEHIATLPDRPKGHASYYLTKNLVLAL
ncbi:GNAT family N-acetyltransferase [Sphingorhabdus sp. EL138]|uniref:GNAT family N-acetyltransferase n=1 Tax=Sphingorhabdus sp. EL138 TaxID=2073156 RepID=UPI000D68F65C|nr:GNAT family N-acetyltransferase [Sphingorhabdus sp. EL138]